MTYHHLCQLWINGFTMKDRSDDPSHHERALLPWSYVSLISYIKCLSLSIYISTYTYTHTHPHIIYIITYHRQGSISDHPHIAGMHCSPLTRQPITTAVCVFCLVCSRLATQHRSAFSHSIMINIQITTSWS